MIRTFILSSIILTSFLCFFSTLSNNRECSCYEPYEGMACQRKRCWNDCNNVGECLPQRVFAEKAGYVYDTPWDSMKVWGCSCDLGYRGVDCSLKECPSMADPLGGFGNESGRECSGRGLCDHKRGFCRCSDGYSGEACQKINIVI